MALSLLDQEGSGQAIVARPAVGLSFTAGGGGGAGGLTDLASAALGIGGGAVPLVDQLVSLRLRRGLAPLVDFVELRLAPRDWAADGFSPPLGVGDSGTVELGQAAAALVKVFTGEVDAIELHGAGLLRATATNGGRRLAQLRVSQSYANQKPGDIIADLAGAADVDVTGAGGAGETLARYAVDDRQPVYASIAELAAAAGRLAAFDAEGKLTLLDPAAPGEVAATLRYGTDIIGFVLADRSANAGAIAVHGAGAPDAAGSNVWAWFRKELGPEGVVTGEGPPQRRYTTPGARSPEAVAQRAASAVQAAERVRSLSRMRVQGAPGIAPGSLVAVESVPGGLGNGEYVVTGLEHRFDAETGLVTDLRISRVGGGGDLLGSLLGAIGGLS